jgi:hypothetical protein
VQIGMAKLRENYTMSRRWIPRPSTSDSIVKMV